MSCIKVIVKFKLKAKRRIAMDWSSFFGAFIGLIFAILASLGAFAIWDYFDRRKAVTVLPLRKPALDDILEKHLEEFIVEHFNELFPGWRIYGDVGDETRPKGIRYRVRGAGEIDMLCLDDNNDFVVIELKRNRAPDKVVSQVDRYIGWVEQNIAETRQDIRGIIIARKPSKHLEYSLSRRSEIDLWAYDWKLVFTPITKGT
jgi:hypothetical protein